MKYEQKITSPLYPAVSRVKTRELVKVIKSLPRKGR